MADTPEFHEGTRIHILPASATTQPGDEATITKVLYITTSNASASDVSHQSRLGHYRNAYGTLETQEPKRALRRELAEPLHLERRSQRTIVRRVKMSRKTVRAVLLKKALLPIGQTLTPLLPGRVAAQRRLPSARRLVWLLLKNRDELRADEQ